MISRRALRRFGLTHLRRVGHTDRGHFGPTPQPNDLLEMAGCFSKEKVEYPKVDIDFRVLIRLLSSRIRSLPFQLIYTPCVSYPCSGKVIPIFTLLTELGEKRVSKCDDSSLEVDFDLGTQ